MIKTGKSQWQAPVITVIVRENLIQTQVLKNCKLQLVIQGDPHNYQYGYCWNQSGGKCNQCLESSSS